MLIHRFFYICLFFVCIGFAFSHNSERYGVMVTPTKVKETRSDTHYEHNTVRSQAYATKYELNYDSQAYVTGFGYGTAETDEFIDEAKTERSEGYYWVKLYIGSLDVEGGVNLDECGSYKGELWVNEMDVAQFKSTGGVSRIEIEAHGDASNQQGDAWCDISI